MKSLASLLTLGTRVECALRCSQCDIESVAVQCSLLRSLDKFCDLKSPLLRVKAVPRDTQGASMGRSCRWEQVGGRNVPLVRWCHLRGDLVCPPPQPGAAPTEGTQLGEVRQESLLRQ